jgi:hypothetical protein
VVSGGRWVRINKKICGIDLNYIYLYCFFFISIVFDFLVDVSNFY